MIVPVIHYKYLQIELNMKDTQRETNFNKLDIYKEKGKVIISKRSKFLGVVELTEKEAEKCYQMIGDLIGKVDFKKQMEEDKKLYGIR